MCIRDRRSADACRKKYSERDCIRKNDREFLPDAVRRWNYTKYKKKLNAIAMCIRDRTYAKYSTPTEKRIIAQALSRISLSTKPVSYTHLRCHYFGSVFRR